MVLMAAERMVGRVGAAAALAAGGSMGVARTLDDYHQIAVALASKVSSSLPRLCRRPAFAALTVIARPARWPTEGIAGARLLALAYLICKLFSEGQRKKRAAARKQLCSHRLAAASVVNGRRQGGGEGKRRSAEEERVKGEAQGSRESPCLFDTKQMLAHLERIWQLLWRSYVGGGRHGEAAANSQRGAAWHLILAP